MQRQKTTHPAVIVIFGITGDLANRRLVPALYHLFGAKWLDARSYVIGVGRRHLTQNQFLEATKDSLSDFSRTDFNQALWSTFADQLFYHETNFNDAAGYRQLAKLLDQLDTKTGSKLTRVFYLSTPASLYDEVAHQLKDSGLNSPQSRIVIEKPFGHDLESAQQLNKTITTAFIESQIYRIDHYLGKEVVQNLMAFRFANGIFEPIWNRHYIDNIQITVAESLGVESRGRFYEETGALRDFAQNHMMHLIAHIAMEQPNSLESDSIRDERIRVMEAVKMIDSEQVDDFAIRGQYIAGVQDGETKLGYRDEENVEAKSDTETFFALKLQVENERFAGVPFYLRHGKRLNQRVSEIAVQFKAPPQHLFETEPNVLTLRIQPDEQVGIRIVAKQPGFDDILTPVDMRLNYQEAFQAQVPEAYERLLLDVINGHQMLFIRNDAIETSWKLIDPIRKGWQQYSKRPLYQYPVGSWGPKEASAFIKSDHRNWLLENAPAKVVIE